MHRALFITKEMAESPASFACIRQTDSGCLHEGIDLDIPSREQSGRRQIRVACKTCTASFGELMLEKKGAGTDGTGLI